MDEVLPNSTQIVPESPTSQPDITTNQVPAGQFPKTEVLPAPVIEPPVSAPVSSPVLPPLPTVIETPKPEVSVEPPVKEKKRFSFGMLVLGIFAFSAIGLAIAYYIIVVMAPENKVAQVTPTPSAAVVVTPTPTVEPEKAIYVDYLLGRDSEMKNDPGVIKSERIPLDGSKIDLFTESAIPTSRILKLAMYSNLNANNFAVNVESVISPNGRYIVRLEKNQQIKVVDTHSSNKSMDEFSSNTISTAQLGEKLMVVYAADDVFLYTVEKDKKVTLKITGYTGDEKNSQETPFGTQGTVLVKGAGERYVLLEDSPLNNTFPPGGVYSIDLQEFKLTKIQLPDLEFIGSSVVDKPNNQLSYFYLNAKSKQALLKTISLKDGTLVKQVSVNGYDFSRRFAWGLVKSPQGIYLLDDVSESKQLYYFLANGSETFIKITVPDGYLISGGNEFACLVDGSICAQLRVTGKKSVVNVVYFDGASTIKYKSLPNIVDNSKEEYLTVIHID